MPKLVSEDFEREYSKLVKDAYALRRKVNDASGNAIQRNDATGLTIEVPFVSDRSATPDPPVEAMGKVTGLALNGVTLGIGLYAGVKALPTGDLSDATLNAAAGTQFEVSTTPILIYNVFEGGAESSALKTNTFVRGWYRGWATIGGVDYQVLQTARYPDGVLFACLTKQVSGSDGTPTTYASWNYDGYPLWDTTYTRPLTSTPVEPERSPARMFKGPVTQAPDGSVGLGYFATDGSFHLWDCQELRETASCA